MAPAHAFSKATAHTASLDAGVNPRFLVAQPGVVVAYAHVRGGSEKGRGMVSSRATRRRSRTLARTSSRPRSYPIAEGYTSRQHLTGRGTSAGGITISRATTDRPDLMVAAVVNVGDANAMRMEFTPNGPVNTPEFGTVKDPAEAQALYEMDGLQHVKPGVRYPAVLGVAGWNDPRVMAWEPGKFVAAVQQATTSGRPAPSMVNYDNGHFTEEKSVTFRNLRQPVRIRTLAGGTRGLSAESVIRTSKTSVTRSARLD